MLLVGYISENNNDLSSRSNSCTVARSCYCDDPRSASSFKCGGKSRCCAGLSHSECAIDATGNGNGSSTHVGEGVGNLEDKLSVESPGVASCECDCRICDRNSDETHSIELTYDAATFHSWNLLPKTTMMGEPRLAFETNLRRSRRRLRLLDETLLLPVRLGGCWGVAGLMNAVLQKMHAV